MECVAIDTSITRFQKMRRGVLTSCRLLESDAKAQDSKSFAVFGTLTLRDDVTWDGTMMKEFTHRIRSWCSRRGIPFRYTWSAELTKRKRLHYHFLVWLPRGLMLPKPDRQGWWSWGSTRVEKARCAGGYIAKYLSKVSADISHYPSGARIHGCGGLSGQSLLEARWWRCPSWVREKASSSDRPMRSSGGGFVCRATGELLKSPWLVVGIASGILRMVLRSEWEARPCGA